MTPEWLGQYAPCQYDAGWRGGQHGWQVVMVGMVLVGVVVGADGVGVGIGDGDDRGDGNGGGVSCLYGLDWYYSWQ